LQDYTLVAIAAVAAHLMKAGLGEDYGLRKLAERHGHDAAALDQVGVGEKGTGVQSNHTALVCLLDCHCHKSGSGQTLLQ
jgi:hypothetical protein